MSRLRALLWAGLATAALIGLGVALLWPRWRGVEPLRREVGRGSKRAVPAPMFSKEYAEALGDILELEESDATKLRERVARNADDLTARLRLLAYYKRADQMGRAENVARRWEQVSWLAQHRPESEILRSPQAHFAAGELTAEQSGQLRDSWEEALSRHGSDARVWWNAACFFRGVDAARWLAYLRRAAELDPASELYGRELGLLYGGVLLTAKNRRGVEVGMSVEEARRELDRTPNGATLEAAVRLLQSAYNQSQMMGREDPELHQLAQYYFERARAVNPELDEAWVMPRLEPQMKGMLTRGAPHHRETMRFAEAARSMRRVLPDEVSELPERVKAELRRRGCTIPQTRPNGVSNAVRGEFYAAGEPAWAVLCSVKGRSTVLVFKEEGSPDEFGAADDLAHIQDAGGGRMEYSREIRAVGRDFIVRHYRAYGGAVPPAIEHQAVDDAFLGKASVTYYCSKGNWMRLQGAD